MNLEKMAEKYRDAGYSERNADARVCQDIVLKAITLSNLGRNVLRKTWIWILSGIHWKMNQFDILF